MGEAKAKALRAGVSQTPKLASADEMIRKLEVAEAAFRLMGDGGDEADKKMRATLPVFFQSYRQMLRNLESSEARVAQLEAELARVRGRVS